MVPEVLGTDSLAHLVDQLLKSVMDCFGLLCLLYGLQVYLLTQSSHGLDEFDFSHSEDSLALDLVDLGHHGTVEIYETVSLDDGTEA